MPKAIGFLVSLAFVCVAAAPAGAQLVTDRNLSYAVAKTMAETAMASCAAQGIVVSIHVINGAGETLVALRADGARPYTFENSYEKAYTAMAFGRPSAEMQAEYAEGNPTRSQQADFPNIVMIAGGLPVIVNGEVVGGIGISGGAGGTNDGCAQAGIDAVAAQLQ